MITITEGLAEIKTISKRIEKKREFIQANVARQSAMKDPLEKDGGSEKAVTQELQSIDDLFTRLIKIRRGINLANLENFITIGGENRCIADWLTWKREVVKPLTSVWDGVNNQISAVKQQAQQKGYRTVAAADQAEQMTDVIFHIGVATVAQKREKIEQILGDLDGQLSLKNATIQIDVP